MGNTVNVPTASELEYVFPPIDLKDDTLPLGYDHGVQNTTCGPSTKLIVNENFWSWNGDTLTIRYSDGSIFGSNIQFQGNLLSSRDRIVLLNGDTMVPVAISMRKFTVRKQVFKIYTPHPVYVGQTMSDRKYNNTVPLYTYANLECNDSCCNTSEVRVTITNDTVQYTISRSGSNWPKKRVVHRDGLVCAYMEGDVCDVNEQRQYTITINPGIDQCLIVLFCGICDQIDDLDNQVDELVDEMINDD